MSQKSAAQLKAEQIEKHLRNEEQYVAVRDVTGSTLVKIHQYRNAMTKLETAMLTAVADFEFEIDQINSNFKS